MNTEEMKDTLAKLTAQIEKTQNHMRRVQKTNNERILRYMKSTKALKANFLAKSECLKSRIKSKGQDNENANLSKRQLENKIRNSTDDFKFENEVIDDRLRTLELQREHINALEKVCNSAKSTLDDSTAKNDALKRELKSQIETFEQNLGVKIRILDDNPKNVSCQLTFTQISSTEPEKEYVLILSPDKKMFKIADCRPPLKDVKNFFEKFHEDDDVLWKFVIEVRSQFENLKL